MPDLAAVVLAAGASRRMQGADKLLLSFDGQPLIHWPVAALRQADVLDVVVVTGANDAAVRGVLADTGARFVHNAHSLTGMASSIRTGVAALPPETRAALICLGDMPAIHACHVRALVAAFRGASPRAICVPTFRGRRGHPILFGEAHFDALRALEGDVGARSVIEGAAADVQLIEMDDGGILQDVDTHDDLVELARATTR